MIGKSPKILSVRIIFRLCHKPGDEIDSMARMGLRPKLSARQNVLDSDLKLNIWLIFERFETIELRILTTFRSKKIEISIRQSLFFGFGSPWSTAKDHGVVPKFLCNLKWPCVIFGPNWWILAQKVWRFWQFTASVFTTEARGWPTDRWNTTKRWSRDDQGVRTLWV